MFLRQSARSSIFRPSNYRCVHRCFSINHTTNQSNNHSNKQQDRPAWLGQAGIAFDIDGVLIRGKHLIESAHSALHRISGPDIGGQSETPIPYILLTNGGGVNEQVKADQFNQWFDLSLPGNAVCLSHSPMQLFVDQYRDQRILVLGMTDVKSVAHSYGFKDVITIKELSNKYPTLAPNAHNQPTGGRTKEIDPSNEQAIKQAIKDASEVPDPEVLKSIKAVFVMHDPNRWYEEIQIMIDVLTSNQTTSPSGVHEIKQIPLYFSNGDFLFTGRHWSPRLAQGSFRTAVEAIYNEYIKQTSKNSSKLQYTMFGKPEPSQFQYAQKLLEARAVEMGYGTNNQSNNQLKRLYMIGDNCAADIRGANQAGDPWTSIWVKTGTIKPTDDPRDVPDVVCENVDEAVKYIIEREKSLANRSID